MDAVVTAQGELELQRLSGCDRSRPALQDPRQLVRVAHRLPSPPLHVLVGAARVLIGRQVDAPPKALPRAGPRTSRDCGSRRDLSSSGLAAV